MKYWFFNFVFFFFFCFSNFSYMDGFDNNSHSRPTMHWSSCSRELIHTSTRDAKYNCLRNRPSRWFAIWKKETFFIFLSISEKVGKFKLRTWLFKGVAIWWLIRKKSATVACLIIVGINAVIRTLVNLVYAIPRFSAQMALAVTLWYI